MSTPLTSATFQQLASPSSSPDFVEQIVDSLSGIGANLLSDVEGVLDDPVLLEAFNARLAPIPLVGEEVAEGDAAIGDQGDGVQADVVARQLLLGRAKREMRHVVDAILGKRMPAKQTKVEYLQKASAFFGGHLTDGLVLDSVSLTAMSSDAAVFRPLKVRVDSGAQASAEDSLVQETDDVKGISSRRPAVKLRPPRNICELLVCLCPWLAALEVCCNCREGALSLQYMSFLASMGCLSGVSEEGVIAFDESFRTRLGTLANEEATRSGKAYNECVARCVAEVNNFASRDLLSFSRFALTSSVSSRPPASGKGGQDGEARPQVPSGMCKFLRSECKALKRKACLYPPHRHHKKRRKEASKK